MVAIIAESTFRESGWGIELFASLTEALRNKRIPFCEVFDAIPPEADGVFILGADHRWLRDVYRVTATAMTGRFMPTARCVL